MNVTRTSDVYERFNLLSPKFKSEQGTPFMEMLSLANAENVQKNAADTDGIGRITLDKPICESDTGNERLDYFIGLGNKYKNSCLDDANRFDFAEMTANADYTGMSDTEKYLAIYEKYQHCYGENFLEARAVYFPGPPCSENTVHRLYCSFVKEMEEAFGSYDKAAAVRREALYGTSDPTETRQAIIDKYVNDGKVTLGDFFKMTNEMAECAVGQGLSFYSEEAINDVVAESQGIFDLQSYIDYRYGKNYLYGINDPYTLKYDMLDKNIGADFIGKLSEYAGANGCGEALRQILSSVDMSACVTAEGRRQIVSADLLNAMRGNSLGVQTLVY